jgi:hypothetical protein
MLEALVIAVSVYPFFRRGKLGPVVLLLLQRIRPTGVVLNGRNWGRRRMGGWYGNSSNWSEIGGFNLQCPEV